MFFIKNVFVTHTNCFVCFVWSSQLKEIISQQIGLKKYIGCLILFRKEGSKLYYRNSCLTNIKTSYKITEQLRVEKLLIWKGFDLYNLSLLCHLKTSNTYSSSQKLEFFQSLNSLTFIMPRCSSPYAKQHANSRCSQIIYSGV